MGLYIAEHIESTK